MNNILIDTCFWYALYDESDEHYKKAQKMVYYLTSGNIILPFPVMYETLDTRFCNRKEWVLSFSEIINRNSTVLVSDDKYRENALNNTFFTNEKRPMSLVDMTIRFMLEDINLNLNVLISFNKKDFIDICQQKGIELISE